MAAIRERRSIRSYLDKPVPEETLSELLEAARQAPSAGNRQEHFFVVAREKKTRAALALAANQPFVGQAPVIIAGVGADPERLMRCRVPAYAVDVAIALTNITLAATARGLGTCWVGAFDQDEVKRILGIPGPARVVQLLTLGYFAENPAPKPRKDARELFCFERFRAR